MNNVPNTIAASSRVCLVTGATGFIGRHLVQQLLEDGWTVRAISRSVNEGSSGTDVDWITSDLFDLGVLTRAMVDVETVFHLAGTGSPSSPFSEVSNMYQTNVVGTLNVLEAARRNGVRRVLTASSAAVYGAIDSQAITEDSEINPATPYGLSKVAQEQVCTMYSQTHGLETLSLRLFNVYGPDEDMSERNTKLIPSVYRLLRQGRPIQVYGDGNQTRDFVHVKDVAAAFVKAETTSFNGQRAVNIGTGVATTIRQVVGYLATALGVDPILEIQPAREGEVAHAVAAPVRAQQMGIHPAVPFEQGINHLIR